MPQEKSNLLGRAMWYRLGMTGAVSLYIPTLACIPDATAWEIKRKLKLDKMIEKQKRNGIKKLQ